MSDHVIVRRKLRSNFTVLDNELINDRRLSWKALGILTYLLHLPPNFRLRLTFLAAQRPTGRDATRSGLRELEAAGYLSISTERHPTGAFAATTWHVTDSPVMNTSESLTPRTGNPNAANPKTEHLNAENPEPRKPTLISTDVKQEFINNNTVEQPSDLIFPNVSIEETSRLKDLVLKAPLNVRQDILDELEAKRLGNKLKGGIMPLARYFVMNLEKFVLTDGLQVRAARQQENVILEIARHDQNKIQNEADSALALMTDAEFLTAYRNYPQHIRGRLEARRAFLLQSTH